MVLTREELEEVFNRTKECGDCLKAYDVKIDSSGVVKIICPYDKRDRYTNSKCNIVGVGLDLSRYFRSLENP